MKKPLAEGDRIVVKFSDGPIMGYFMNYYNGYAVCDLDDQPYGHFLAERRRVFKAPANIQIFEATATDLAGAAGTSTGGESAAPIPAPPPTTKEA